MLQSSGKAVGPLASSIGQSMSPQGGGQGTQAQVGGPPPQMMTPPKINFSAQGAGAAMPAPAPPPMPSFAAHPESQAMMSKLDPKGAAAYSAIQGVSQVLGQWQQKREAKQQAEAANIAQNLVTAIQNGDQGEVSAILNDPKATKVLNKVYKGWLTPAPQQKPQDPEVQAFTQGVAKAASSPQITGGQATSGGGYPITNAGSPQMTQQAPPQQQQTQQQQQQQAPQEGMPRQMGGYMLPQSLPQDLLARAQANAQLSAARQDPGRLLGGDQLTSQEVRQTQIYASGLGVSPKELAVLEAGNQRELVKAYARMVTENIKSQGVLASAERRAKATEGAAETSAGARVKAAGISASARVKAQEIAAKARVDSANILKDAKGKSPDQITEKILDLQKKSAESDLRTLEGKYSDLLKAGKEDAATDIQGRIESRQNEIKDLDRQLDDLKAVGDASSLSQMINQLISGADDTEGDSDASTDDSEQ